MREDGACPTEWLLGGPAWVVYRTLVDLLDQPDDHVEVQMARQSMLADPQVRGLLAELAQWPGRVLNGHKDAGHPLHKLTFLADIGLRAGDPGMDGILRRIREHQDQAGPFQVLMNIPPRYGGTGQDVWAWALCDAPLVLYALIRLGMGQDPSVRDAVRCLAGLVRENGWPCAVSVELGKFRGPGRKDDPCPYANLAMLKALSLVEEWRESQASELGARALLGLWTRRRECHPYMFFMGTDFCKLKAPTVWYDILHLLDTLTRFPWLRGDTRVQEMASLVRARADVEGRFTPESIWKAWAEWEFGQKRAPSRWLTLLACRALGRLDG